MKRRQTIAWFIAMCLCALWYINVNIRQQIPGLDKPSDFFHYHRAAQQVLAGHTPYDGPDFNYPPLIAFLLAPLGFVTYVKARWIWFAVSHACLLTSAWIMWRTLGRNRSAGLCVAFVWAAGGAAGENLSLGQAGPLLVLALAVAYTPRSLAAGISAGIGAALKFIPGVVSIAFALRRDWRAVGGIMVMAVSLVLIPWAVVRYRLEGSSVPSRVDYWTGTPALLNWSLPAVVLRALDPPQGGTSLPYNWEYGNYLPNLHLTPSQQMASVGTTVVIFGAGILALLLVCRGQLDREQLPWALAGLISLSLAASPVCWSHYQVMQYPGLAFLLHRSTKWRSVACVLVCGALLYEVPVAILTAYYKQHGGWTAISPATLYVWTSVTPLACLSLFGIALRQIRHG